MVSLEPHEVTSLVFRRILVFDPALLYVDHQFLSMFVCFLELIEPKCHLGYGGWPIGSISAWVISHEEKERGLLRGLIVPIVMREFHNWKIMGPVVLALIYVASQLP